MCERYACEDFIWPKRTMRRKINLSRDLAKQKRYTKYYIYNRYNEDETFFFPDTRAQKKSPKKTQPPGQKKTFIHIY